MATTYKRNAQQVYKRPIYTLFLPWLVIALAIAGLMTLVTSFVAVVWLRVAVYLIWSLVVIMIGLRSYSIYQALDRLDLSDVTASSNGAQKISRKTY